MPSRSKGNVILRQWEMIQLIPARDHAGKTANDLATQLASRGFHVTSRTIERDLEELQSVLPLDVDNKARPKRWRWRRQPAVDIPGMESAEAIALSLTQETLATHLPASFLGALKRRLAQANRTLAAIAKAGSHGLWTDKVRVIPAHVVLCPPVVPPAILQALQSALLRDVPVEVLYKGHKDQSHQSRLLYPRGMILRGSSVYLIAHEKGGDSRPRHFALQRFGNVRLREMEPWPVTPFSLDVFLKDGNQQFGEGTPITLKAIVSEELARILRDTPLGEDMVLTATGAGTVKLSTTIRDTWSLHTWILGHGPHIQVQSPPALKTLIAERLVQAARQYS